MSQNHYIGFMNTRAAFSFFILILLSACVSTSRYHSMASEKDQFAIQNKMYLLEIDSLKSLTNELELTKELLQKTENVLIEFYVKYNDKLNLMDSAASLKNDNTEFQNINKIKSLETELSNLKLQFQNVQSELLIAENKILKLQEIKPEKISKNKKTDSLHRALSNAKQQLLKNKELIINSNFEIHNLNQIIDSINSQNQFLVLQNKNLEYHLNELKNEQFDETKNESVENKLKESQLKFEIDELTSKLNLLQSNADQQEQTIQTKNIEIQELNQKITQAQSNALQQEQNLQNNIHEIKELNQKLDESKELLENQKIEFTILSEKSKAPDQSTIIQDLKADLELKDKSIHVLNEIIDSKNSEIDKLKQSIKENKEELIASKNQFSEQQDKWSQLQAENTKLRSLQKSNDELNTIKKQLTSLNQKLDQLEAENTNLKNKQKSIEEMNDIKKQLSLQNEKLSQLESENSTLKASQISNEERNQSLTAKALELHQQIQESEKLRKENSELSAALLNKSEQIELLSSKISERSANDSLQLENASIKDSLQYFKDQALKSQHAERTLSAKYQSNQNAIIKINESIDSLNKEIMLRKSNENKLQLSIFEKDKQLNQLKYEISRVQSIQIEKKDNQTKTDDSQTHINTPSTVIKKEDPEYKSSIEKDLNPLKSNYKSIPVQIINKLKAFGKNQTSKGVQTNYIDNQFHILIPMDALFENERFAMKQTGTNLIESMVLACKSSKQIKYQINSFYQVPDKLENNEASGRKKVNTISKLLMVYGIPQSAILISNSMNESKSNTLSIPTGIEIMIYAD
ncbi:MAG: hypothetical protein WAS55_11390 [Saprospiraceae bacterium]